MFKDASSALDYPKVLDAIGAFCLSEASRKAASDLSPMPGAAKIKERSALVGELRYMMQRGDSLGLSPYNAIADILQSLRPEDAMLEPSELLFLMPALIAMTDSAGAIERMQGLLPLTLAFTEGLTGFPSMTVPSALTRDGLPLGVQLINLPYQEEALLRTALWCEEAFGARLWPPDYP